MYIFKCIQEKNEFFEKFQTLEKKYDEVKFLNETQKSQEKLFEETENKWKLESEKLRNQNKDLKMVNQN